MRRSISIGTSAAVAAVFTHGLVFSAVNFDQPTDPGLFRHILIATERLWSYAHGWQPLSHIRDFGHFYAPAIQLICPLLGFTLFCILSRHRVGIHLWKPLAIALLLTLPPTVSDLASRDATPWVEAARTIFIVLLMVWSVGTQPRGWNRLRGRVQVALQP